MYVCDGSVVAANLGVNPSLTITALERARDELCPVGPASRGTMLPDKIEFHPRRFMQFPHENPVTQVPARRDAARPPYYPFMAR